MQEMQEQMNSMNDSGEFQEVESNYSGRLSSVPGQQAATPSSCFMLSRDKHMEYFWTTGIRFPYSSRNHYQGIHHFATPGATGSVPAHIGTGTPVARDENRLRGTIPMPTFARRSTMSSLIRVDIPLNSMVGQQRQQKSGPQFHKFLSLSTFLCWKIRIETKWLLVQIFHRWLCYGSKKKRWSIHWINKNPRAPLLESIFQILRCRTRRLP